MLEVYSRRSARLQLHSVDDELDGEGVSVLGDERLDELSGDVDLSDGGVVLVGDGGVGRREEGG